MRYLMIAVEDGAAAELAGHLAMYPDVGQVTEPCGPSSPVHRIKPQERCCTLCGTDGVAVLGAWQVAAADEPDNSFVSCVDHIGESVAHVLLRSKADRAVVRFLDER